jgi:hypothetical protein
VCLLAVIYETPLSRWLVTHTTGYWTRLLLFVPLALGYLAAAGTIPTFRAVRIIVLVL